MAEGRPDKYGYRVWDGVSLSAYIKKTYDVDLCVRHCQRLFHTLGFSLVRPRTFPNKGELNEVERAVYKKITELKNDSTAVIVFQVEVHFQITTSVTRKWVLKGSKPQMKSAPGRKNVPYSGFVCPATGELIVTKPISFRFKTTLEEIFSVL